MSILSGGKGNRVTTIEFSGLMITCYNNWILWICQSYYLTKEWNKSNKSNTSRESIRTMWATSDLFSHQTPPLWFSCRLQRTSFRYFCWPSYSLPLCSSSQQWRRHSPWNPLPRRFVRSKDEHCIWPRASYRVLQHLRSKGGMEDKGG